MHVTDCKEEVGDIGFLKILGDMWHSPIARHQSRLVMDVFNVKSCTVVRISTHILALLVGIYLLTLLFLYHYFHCLRSLKRIIWLKLSRFVLYV